MLQGSIGSKQGLHHLVLRAALIVLSQDLTRRGTHAWTYNYSISLSRGWHEARQWCQQHFTDMVFIRTQEENDHLINLLPYHSRHYWIGIRRERGEWIWTQNNRKVPLEVQNWAVGEPNGRLDHDCVEFYVKRLEEAGRWNDEHCLKRKGTVCYRDSCKQDSCSVHADCVETVGNFTCKCHPGFTGLSCQEAIACKPFLDPEQGSCSCVSPFGSDRFNSSCRFQCELGFQLTGVSQLLCQASGEWSHPVPVCQVKRCPALNLTNTIAGSMNCSHPIAPYSYNSTCEVRWSEGYEFKGLDKIRCDHDGKWSASVPARSDPAAQLRFIMVSAGLAFLIITVLTVNMWAKTTGNKAQMDQHTVQEGDGVGVVIYENSGDHAASVRLQTPSTPTSHEELRETAGP